MTDKIILLVDMDNTIAMADDGLTNAGMEIYDVYYRNSLEFEGKLETQAMDIMRKPGFFLNLKPWDGAVETLKRLEAKHNFEIWFVTSPFNSETCMQEKKAWIGKHFNCGTKDGEEKNTINWQDRIIQTKDKTMIRGNVLIDDHPDMGSIPGKSAHRPLWKHVLFSQNYNRKSDKPRIVCWDFDHVLSILSTLSFSP